MNEHSVSHMNELGADEAGGLLDQILSAIRSQQRDDLIRLLKDVGLRRSTVKGFHLACGIGYFQTGDLPAAVVHFVREGAHFSGEKDATALLEEIHKEQNIGMVCYEVGLKYQQEGNFQEANFFADEACKAVPESAKGARHFLGYLFLQLGRVNEGEQMLLHELQKNVLEETATLDLLLELYRVQGREVDSRLLLMRYLEMYPSCESVKKRFEALKESIHSNLYQISSTEKASYGSNTKVVVSFSGGADVPQSLSVLTLKNTGYDGEVEYLSPKSSENRGAFLKERFKPGFPLAFLSEEMLFNTAVPELFSREGDESFCCVAGETIEASPAVSNLCHALGVQVKELTVPGRGPIVFFDAGILNSWAEIKERVLGSERLRRYFDEVSLLSSSFSDRLLLAIGAKCADISPRVFPAGLVEAFVPESEGGATQSKVVVFQPSQLRHSGNFGAVARFEGSEFIEALRMERAGQPFTARRESFSASSFSKSAAQLVRSPERGRKLLVGLCRGIGNVIVGTPLLRALLQMGYEVDLLDGYFHHHSEALLDGLGVQIVSSDEAEKKRNSYMLGVQSVMAAPGLEHFVQDVYLLPPLKEIERQGHYLHEVELNMGLAYSLGFTGEVPALYCAYEESEISKQVGQTKKTVGIAVAGSYKTIDFAKRQYPAMPELAQLLSKAGYNIVLVGGPGSEEEARKYPEGSLNAIGKLSLTKSAGVIRALDYFVSEDCGMMHMAAALGTPMTAIFGPSSTIKNRPWSDSATVISREMSCVPCQHTALWSGCGRADCMDIPPEAVAEVVLAELERLSDSK